MAVETASFISQLNASYPAATDLLSEGDNHIRLTKSVLQTQFTSLGAQAVTATAVALNYTANLTSDAQTQINNLLSLYSSVANGATLWVSGTTYAAGALVYSPTNFQTYRKTTASSVSTVDPINDSTNWALLGGQVPDFLLMAQGVR